MPAYKKGFVNLFIFLASLVAFFSFVSPIQAINCEFVGINDLPPAEAHPHPGESVTITGLILDKDNLLPNLPLYMNVFHNFVTDGLGEICPTTNRFSEIKVELPNKIPSITEPKKYTIFIDNKASYMPLGCTSNSVPFSPSVCMVDFWAWPTDYTPPVISETPTPIPPSIPFTCKDSDIQVLNNPLRANSLPLIAGKVTKSDGTPLENANIALYFRGEGIDPNNPLYDCTSSGQRGEFLKTISTQVPNVKTFTNFFLDVFQKSDSDVCSPKYAVPACFVKLTAYPANVQIPPTSTPAPTSNINRLKCDSGGTVLTSIPHNPFGFPYNSPSVTFSFKVKDNAQYRMIFDAGLGTWECLDAKSTINPNSELLQWTINDYFKSTHDFKLQIKEGENFKNCPRGPSVSGVSEYNACSWKIQSQQSQCSLQISYTNGSADTLAHLFVTGRGVPPEILVHRYGYRLSFYRIGDTDNPKPIKDDIIYPTTFDKDVGEWSREKTYLARISYSGWDCLTGDRSKCYLDCATTETTIPKTGESTNQPPTNPQPGSGQLPQSQAYEICKPLCERIIDDTTKNQCKNFNTWALKDIPLLGGVLGKLQDIDDRILSSKVFGANPVYIRAPSDPLRLRFERAMDDFFKDKDNQQYEAVRCVDCFQRGGAYTALGCIPTNLPGIIKSAFSILIPIMGGILFLGIIYTGFMIIVSSGDPKKIEELRSQITSLIVGFIVFIGAVFIYGFIGGTILGLPGIHFQ